MKRPSLIFGLTLIGTIGTLYGLTSAILLRSFLQVERQKTEESVKQVLSAFVDKQKTLFGGLVDYAAWTATYDFVQGKKPDYTEVDLTDATFVSMKVDMVALTTSQNQLFYGTAYDLRKRAKVALSPGLQAKFKDDVFMFTKPEQSQMGLLMVDQKPILIGAHPILTSEGQGPVQGTLIFGQYLDQNLLTQLETITRLSISVQPIMATSDPRLQKIQAQLLAVDSGETNQIIVQPLSQTEVAGYRLVDDIHGQPIFMLQVTSPRTVYQQGLVSLRYLAIVLLLVAIGAGSIMWFLIRRSIQHLTERDWMQQALAQETKLRLADAKYREKAQALEQTLHELKQAQAQLIHSEKMSSLGHLVAGIAHEINNPVNFISGNLSYADSYAQDLLTLVQLYQQHCRLPAAAQAQVAEIDPEFVQQDFPKLLASMQIGAERIQSIVRSLRNFSRLDEMAVKAVDLHEGLDSTVLLLKNRLRPKSGQFEIELVRNYGELPLVECYPSQLNQVFMNLLSNAIDALEEQIAEPEFDSTDFTPTIWIETAFVEQVEIRIRNNGPAIPESAQKHLFDPFFTTKQVGKGTGLGLAISYQIIVDKHQGQIFYRNLANTAQASASSTSGVEFVVQIPTQLSPSAVQPEPAPTPS
ncbi:MAG: CHASE4 domain-containing protein [Elainella sp.]